MTTDDRIPFFNYPALFTAEEERLLDIVRDVGRRGAFIQQRDLAEFETTLARSLASADAVGVANATDGIELALLAAGLEPGGEVIICSHTMIATAAAVHFAGGIPVPVDMGDDGLLDPAAAAAAVTPRTVGILPTHLNGRTCTMTAIQEVADRHRLFVVEDAAQALGSRFRGRAAGTFGVAGAISFYPAKVLGCLGDGGAVVCREATAGEAVRQLRDHGRDRDGVIRRWGRNSRLDNLQAAILADRFAGYDRIVRRRRELAARYHAQLHDLAALRLPPPPIENGDHFDIYQNYELEADRRDALREHLAGRGVGTLIQWGGTPVHGFRTLGFAGTGCPRTEAFFRRCLMLPLNMTLTDAQQDRVCREIRGFYGG